MDESIAFADVSFLISLYIPRADTGVALKAQGSLKRPLSIARPGVFEFENTLRLMSFRRASDRQGGMSQITAVSILASFELDIESGLIEVRLCDLEQVFALASALSNKHTWHRGYRSFDILHVAAAQHLGATRFLTFDKAQRALAEAEGMDTSLGPVV